MTHRIAGLMLLTVAIGLPADKNAIPTVRGENGSFQIEAKLYKGAEELQRLFGQEIENGIAVLAVTITPKGSEPFQVWRDDFILRSDKDGQKSEPYDPGQIAGNTVLTLLYREEGGGDVAQEQQSGGWGGLGGQMPGRLPGTGPSGVGNTRGFETVSDAKVSDGEALPENPLLTVLQERILKEDKITDPASGLLYYPLEGKHKIKQIWLHYTGDAGKIDLQFKKPK